MKRLSVFLALVGAMLVVVGVARAAFEYYYSKKNQVL